MFIYVFNRYSYISNRSSWCSLDCHYIGHEGLVYCVITETRGQNKRNFYCRLKLWPSDNGAGGLRELLGSKMPLDWLKIGLNSAEKITLLFLRVLLES